MGKTLIIHHLEMLWQSAYKKYGTSFDQLAQDVIEHIEENEYDWVILTQFENWEAQPEHHESGLSYYVDQWEDYGYGWEREEFEGQTEGVDFCDGGVHSEVVLLEDWMRQLTSDNVHICGAFDGECIDDLETALEYLNIDYTREIEIIV